MACIDHGNCKPSLRGKNMRISSPVRLCFILIVGTLLLLEGCRGISDTPGSGTTPGHGAGSNDSSGSLPFSEPRSTPQSAVISPTPDKICEISNIEKLLKDAERNFPGIFGASFQEISSGLHCGIKEGRTFQAASVIKVPVLYELYRRQREGKLDLEETIRVTEQDFVGGGGVIKEQSGSRYYSLSELATLMITKSDNTATDLLIKYLGMDDINSTMKKLGLTNTSVKRLIFDFYAMDRGFDNLTTPLDMRRLLVVIHVGQARDRASLEMLSILKSVNRRDMIPAGLPEDVPVAHKTGELSGVLLDVAIVYLKEKPYILCLMGEEIQQREAAIKSFAALSKKIYAEMKKAGMD